MNFLSYILVLILTFFGLVFGMIVSYIAKEELKDGKRYFIILQNAFLILILFSFLYYLKVWLAVNIFLCIIFLVSIIFYLKKIKNPSLYFYPVLGIIFYISSKNADFFITESILIFLYGFPTAGLILDARKKNYLSVVLKNASFLVLGILLFFI